MNTVSLGDRMKQNYENRSRYYLTRRTPVIIRLDGKSFYTFTRGFAKPFDIKLRTCMIEGINALIEEVQGFVCAYHQSDEISICIMDYKELESQAWFDYNLQKLCSVSSSIVTQAFNAQSMVSIGKNDAVFDARAFNIPKEEVYNYFLWRQNDWVTNSVSMVAQSLFSYKELHKKSIADMRIMIKEKDIDYDDYLDYWKYGTFIMKDTMKQEYKMINGTHMAKRLNNLVFNTSV